MKAAEPGSRSTARRCHAPAGPRILFACVAALLFFVTGWIPCAAASAVRPPEPLKVIFDTDMDGDDDDVAAAAILHALADAGRVQILAMGVVSRCPQTPACLDAINTYYGRGDIPIGVYKGSTLAEVASPYAAIVAGRCPNDIGPPDKVPDVLRVYRRTLSAQPDGAVTMIAVGQMNNLVDLLNSPPDSESPLAGRELVRRKVAALFVMGPYFSEGNEFHRAYNFTTSPKAAAELVRDWPTQVRFGEGILGHRHFIGSHLSETPAENPARIAFEAYSAGEERRSGKPERIRHCADPTTVLYAVCGTQYFGEVGPGACEVREDGYTRWSKRGDGRQFYNTQKLPVAELEDVMEKLLVQPPARGSASKPAAPQEPPFRTLDLNRGDEQEVELSDGRRSKVKLLEVREERDSLRSAVRRSTIRIEIDGTATTISSGNYHLPVTVGDVQIDCPIIKAYYANHDPFEDSWGLVKDARVRLWPKGSPWLKPGTFVYPVKQRWFAGPTQIGNEPSYVDGGDHPPAGRPIYYHAGNDLGGCEGMVDVVSACDGVVASAGGKAINEYADAPFYKPRGDYDYVYVVDARGWFYRYAHLQSIDPAVRPGERVKMGQKIGVLGKEGSSGGWAHLHFDIKAKQPSGQWGVQDAYPFLWEAYEREHKPKVIAVARPHHLAAVGETIRLDGSGSWSATGAITRYEWAFGNGESAEGPTVERTYRHPGSFSEILKVTDAAGEVDCDFAVVQVLDKDPAKKLPPTVHAAYAPTTDIGPGDPVTFKVRTFRTAEGARGDETWDFGDGSDRVTVHSGGSAKEHDPEGYAATTHRFKKPGRYLVRVEGRGADGMTAVGHLQVRVAEQPRAGKGQTLYNGIQLPETWPPRLARFPTSVETEPVAPPYLTSPPAVIPADWISPGDDGGRFDYQGNPPAADGKKVSLADTDHIYGTGGDAAWVWKAFLRGHNPICMDPLKWDKTLRVAEADIENARRAMGQTRRLAERVDLIAMTPAGELASTKYCLAAPGKRYLISLPQGDTVTVDLSAVNGEFAVEWLDPTKDNTTAAGGVIGGKRREPKAPFEGPAVLYLSVKSR